MGWFVYWQTKISIHAPSQGATINKQKGRLCDGFQSTPPHRGRQRATGCMAFGLYFNPRPLTGGDGLLEGTFGAKQISIHAPSQGATRSKEQHDKCNAFQSTPPHRGRRRAGKEENHETNISIHAPSQGATNANVSVAVVCDISIHAPSQGATSRVRRRAGHGTDFNPRPLTGGDNTQCLLPQLNDISIHAPSQGATSALRHRRLKSAFQSTPPHRGRPAAAAAIRATNTFQSTPPHRGRLQLCTKKHNHNNNLYKKVLSLREKNEKYFQYTTISLEISSFLRCESPGNFMYPLYSHPMIFTTKSTACPDPVHDQHQYAPPLSYDDSQDSKTERCPFLGQLSPQERL